MTGRNIIFLDIDGTLSSAEYGKSCYDIDLPRVLVDDKVPLCEKPVSCLKQLLETVENPGIVWTTDWRFDTNETWNSWKNPKLWLERQSWLSDLVIGITPKKMSSNRHEEIFFWLHENEYNRRRGRNAFDIWNFVIFDDCAYGMSRYGWHFFESDYRTGITAQQCEKAVEYLKTPDYSSTDWICD